MDDLAICRAVRARVVDCTGIDPLKELKVMGALFEPSGRKLWVEEHLIGGTPGVLTNRRSRCTVMIQYDINVPAGYDMLRAEAVASKIAEEFDPDDLDKSSLLVDNTTTVVQSIGKSRFQSDRLSGVKVLLTISAVEKS